MNTLNNWINENMNTQEELLSAILTELRKINERTKLQENQDALVDCYYGMMRKQQQESKGWMPELYKQYGFVDNYGDWEITYWGGGRLGERRHAIGNCYQLHEEERAIWEQVTRRKYETALWDAADWVKGDYYLGFWNNAYKKIDSLIVHCNIQQDTPRFATHQSAIDAHTRILGDDAERYFRGRV
jgi:hypothetical protein